MSQSDTDKKTSEKQHFTSNIVHFDRDMPHANGAIHYPIHPSTQYTFSDVDELIGVFQGKTKGNWLRLKVVTVLWRLLPVWRQLQQHF